MGVGPKMKDIWIKAFRGLNVRDHSFMLNEGEFTVLENFKRDTNELVSRGGSRNYLIKNFLNITTGVRGMFRYRTSTGTKKIILNAGGEIYGDADDGQFASLTTMTPDADGFVSFEQYRDTLLIASDQNDLVVYNTGDATPAQTPSLTPKAFTASGKHSATASSGAGELLGGKTYFWRVTFDVSMDDDFLGETPASGTTSAWETFSYTLPSTPKEAKTAVVAAGGSGYVVGDLLVAAGGTTVSGVPGLDDAKLTVTQVDGSGAVLEVMLDPDDEVKYLVVPANPVSHLTPPPGSTVGTGATFTMTWGALTWRMVFKRPSDVVVDAVPAYCSRVNFYRSPPFDSPLGISGYSSRDEATALNYVGSVDMATVRAASAGATIFTDAGIAPGKQISYGIHWHSPRARHIVMHKGRLWGANIKTAPNAATAVYESHPNRIIFSRFADNGLPEPLAFQIASPEIQIAPYTGEGITALASWREKILIATTPRTTHAIVGGDDFISLTIPRLYGEILSPVVGCIAPKTMIQIGDALVWMSHAGLVYFDGRGPLPLVNNENIIPIIESIPADRRRLMCSEPDSRDRVLRIYYTPEGATANTRALCVHIPSGFWWIEKPRAGVGSVMEINESDALPKTLVGHDDAAGLFGGADWAIVSEVDTGTLDLNKTGGQGFLCTFETGFIDFGRAALNKKLYRVAIEGEWYSNITVYVRGDGTKDTQTDVAPLVFEPPPGNKGLVMKAFAGDYVIGAKRLQLVGSGLTTNGPIHITRAGFWLNPDGEWVEDVVQ